VIGGSGVVSRIVQIAMEKIKLRFPAEQRFRYLVKQSVEKLPQRMDAFDFF
jgi:hypothetical protein